jgi:colicin import membrane protein
MKMAGGPVGNGDARSTGSAAQSSGPSAGYAGRIRARIKPNITFMDNVAGNPTAEVEVRTSPDGTIISRRLTQSSGVKSWDDAVLNAIDKTEVLPRDTDGRVPTSLVISFRPKD